jgi:hypothetical protein
MVKVIWADSAFKDLDKIAEYITKLAFSKATFFEKLSS